MSYQIRSDTAQDEAACLFGAGPNVGREGFREAGEPRSVLALGRDFDSVGSLCLADVHGGRERSDRHPDTPHSEEPARTNAVVRGARLIDRRFDACGHKRTGDQNRTKHGGIPRVVREVREESVRA